MMLSLIRDRACRRLLAAHLQSSLGDGAGYVALMLIAIQRLDSPWALTMVLLADFVPAVALGMIFGAAADRWSRRKLAVTADLLRMVAFTGLLLVDSFAATVALAALAGVGTAMFRPAMKASLPGLAGPERIAPMTSLYTMIRDAGFTSGPALAGLLLLAINVETLLAVNAATFAISALLLARLPMDRGREPRTLAADADEGTPGVSWRAEIRDGLALMRRLPGLAALLGCAAGMLLAAGELNVAEPLIARDALGVGASGFGLLVACNGIGQILGGLVGARQRSLRTVRGLYVAGISLSGLGLLAIAGAPTLALAGAAFALCGFGNGIELVHDQQLIQRVVPEHVLGRVYGLKDTLEASAFGLAVLLGGALVTLAGPRFALAASGAAVVVIAVCASGWLRALTETPRRAEDDRGDGAPAPAPAS